MSDRTRHDGSRGYNSWYGESPNMVADGGGNMRRRQTGLRAFVWIAGWCVVVAALHTGEHCALYFRWLLKGACPGRHRY